MQGLPTLPTDNLYKFIAVASMVFAFGTLIAALYKERQDFDWEVSERRQFFQRHHERLLAGHDPKVIDQIKNEDISELNLEIEARRKFAVTTSKGFLDWTLLCLGMSGFGFALWWYKVQKYQDAILRFEYESDRNDHALRSAACIERQ
jgi:hypothetical protein